MVWVMVIGYVMVLGYVQVMVSEPLKLTKNTNKQSTESIQSLIK